MPIDRFSERRFDESVSKIGPINHLKLNRRSKGDQRMANYEILLMGDGSHLFRTIAWVLEYKGYRSQGGGQPRGGPGSPGKKEL